MHAQFHQSCLILYDPIGHSPPGSSVHEIFSGKNTRVGCHDLLQGIFPTQGIIPHVLHCSRFFTTEPWGKLIYSSVYMLIPISQFSLPAPPLVTLSLFSTSGTLLPFCRQFVCTPSSSLLFLRFHIQVISYDICLSVPDLFQSVWQYLGASVPLQMVHCFLWQLSASPLSLTKLAGVCLSLLLSVPCHTHISLFWWNMTWRRRRLGGLERLAVSTWNLLFPKEILLKLPGKAIKKCTSCNVWEWPGDFM